MKNGEKLGFFLKSFLNDTLHKNAIYLMINTLGTSAIGFIFWIIVARYYVPEDIGLGASLISIIILLGVLSTLGLNIGLVRYLPEGKVENTKAIINTSFTIGVISSLFLAVIFILGVDLWAPRLTIIRENYIFLFLFLIFSSVQTSCLLIASIFVARRQAKWVLISDTLLSGFTKLFLILIFIKLSVIGIVTAWGISLTIGIIFSIGIVLPRIYESYRPRINIKLKMIREMLRFSILNYISDILNRIPMLLMPLIIVNLLSPSHAAYFYFAWMLAGLLYVIPLSTCTSLLAEGSTSRENLSIFFQKAVKLLFVLLFPTMLILWTLGEYILLIFGPVYSTNALPLLRIFIVAVIPYSANVIFVTLERIGKKMNLVILIYSIIAIVTLGLSYFLIQEMGIIGISWAWLIAHTIALIVIIFLKRKKILYYFKQRLVN